MSHTSAGKLASELKSFTASLRESSTQLSAEIANIQKSRADIQKEYDATAKTFVQNTLPELTGEQFDTYAELAQKTPELTGQGLAFYRQQLLTARETALAAVNNDEKRSETVDADSFQGVLKEARGKHENASEHIGAADGVTTGASTDLAKWKKTAEYGFVALNEEISAKGAIPLSADPKSRERYNPAIFEVPVVGLVTAMWNWCTRDASYRKVRSALVKFDQGDGGKDIFADIANHKKKTDTLSKAVTDAQSAAQAVRAQFADIEKNYAKLSGLAKDIQTDGQVLELVRDKASSYLSTPEFAKAAADQYGEDFPRGIQLMAAKLTTLGKLEEGAQAKMTALKANIDAANGQYKKASGLDSDTQVNIDLEAVRRQNAARRDAFNNYTRATKESWDRTTTYTPPSTTVYVNRGPDFFQTLILAEILMSNQNHEDHSSSRHDAPASPSVLTPYSADLLGIDKALAGNLGVPDSAFDLAPAHITGGGMIPDDAFDILSTGHAASALDRSLSQQISNAIDAEEEAARSARASSTTSFGNAASGSSSPTETFTFPSSGGGGSGGGPEKFDI